MNTDPRIEAAARQVAVEHGYPASYFPDGMAEVHAKSYRERAARIIAAADKAATITTVQALDARPVGTVVVSERYKYSLTHPNYPVSFQKLYDGRWHRGGRSSDTCPGLIVPARAIHWGNE